ncbi:MAG: GIY-YIG nuclease family protein [Pseudomonadota bacterium]
MTAYVYILASASSNALYIGAAAQLRERLAQHRAGTAGAHTARYRIHRLIWFEAHDDLRAAREREHRLKRWRRAWKEALVAERNPAWRDLSAEVPR